MRAGIDVIINAHQIKARESPMLIKVRNFQARGDKVFYAILFS